MRFRIASIVLSAALFAGCGGRGAEAHRAMAAAAKVQYWMSAGAPIRVPYSSYPEIVYPVLIRGPAGTHAVPGLFVADSSALAAVFDSLAFAAGFDSRGAMIGLVRFHGLSGQLDTLASPRGYSPNLTSLAWSPDGRYLAYVEVDGGGQPYGVVRSAADQAEVLRTPPVAAAATNAQIGFARYLGPGEFVLAVSVDPSHDRWVRFHAEIGAPKMAQDTVTGSSLATTR